MTRPTIVAIGGGSLRRRETEKIDQHVIGLTGSRNPRALYIPTASLDNPTYVKYFEDAYGAYGCKVDALLLYKERHDLASIEEKILSCDLVYVGGGNTLFLYNALRYHGVDTVLRRAWERGTVISGLSAGCIIWHDRGLTDSIHKKFIEMGGLGWVPRFVSPHYLREPRRRGIFQEIVEARGYEGLAIDDNCAVVYEGTAIKEVVSLGEDYGARIVRAEGGRAAVAELDKTLLEHRVEANRQRLKARLRR
ncbi:MAG: Type 1 glutamine amidotransferase-like domain-containing protein [Candidatus Lokiarchaeota archaeon]|nr:Type 1 glutamine amidotransferase-like domain-containing protein [Candidatus Lokiarchaeota archaeon]